MTADSGLWYKGHSLGHKTWPLQSLAAFGNLLD